MLNVGAISRAANSFSANPLQAYDRRQEMLAVDALGEIEQQFQFPIHGKATSKLTFVEALVNFDVHFYNATEQRNIPYTEPGFYFGYSITSDVPVLVTACVRSWQKRIDDAVTGCVLALGVLGPLRTPVEFKGSLHAFFQGYGAPIDSDADLEAPSEYGGSEDAPDPGDPGEDE